MRANDAELVGEDADDAGDDQVGALDLCAALCADGGAAGGAWAAGLARRCEVAWILVAMVTARSSAMAFNRWADAELDAANPRTWTRAIPAGLLTRGFVLGFTLLMAAVFVAAAAELNRLTLVLSPLVLAVLWGYSYMKRADALVAPGAGAGAGPCALGGVDCGARLAGRADSGADGGGDAVGGRL